MRVVTRFAPAVLGAAMMLGAGAVAADDAVATQDAVAAQEGEAPTSSFAVEEQTVDVGDVTAGETAVAVFRFHNTGDSEVRILRAKPS